MRAAPRSSHSTRSRPGSVRRSTGGPRAHAAAQPLLEVGAAGAVFARRLSRLLDRARRQAHRDIPLQQPVGTDRQLVRPPAGRVVHGVADRGRHRHGGDLAEADAAAGHVLEALLVEVDVDLGGVADAGDPVVLEAGAQHDPALRVVLALLVERVADALDDAAVALAARQLGRGDAAGGDSGGRAEHPGPARAACRPRPR